MHDTYNDIPYNHSSIFISRSTAQHTLTTDAPDFTNPLRKYKELPVGPFPPQTQQTPNTCAHT